MAYQGGNLKSTSINGVKMYTVSSHQRSLATWLPPKKLRALRKNNDYLQRVDLIQDLRFETATTKIKATPDGEFLIASGIYPPQVKVYELRELSLKFERHLVSEIIDFQKFTVPQRFFCHFYVVAVVWTTLLLLATWLYAYRTAPLASEPLLYSTVASHLTGGSHIFSLHKPRPTPLEHRYLVWRSVFLLLLMEVQVMRRLYETIYVFNYSRSARMHVFGYLTGMFFYTAAPLSLCCVCAPEVFKFSANQLKEFIVKGKNQMPVIEFDWWGYVNSLMKLGWHSCLGAAIIIWGWIHQHRCHAILGLLREHKEQEDEYGIPHGDWFEIVSSPHYLAVIVIYGGLVVASGGSDLTIWLLFGFVASNLIFAAAETQRWYLHKFDNYPSNRFVIIPFVF